jgi:putative DNA primase/helicase
MSTKPTTHETVRTSRRKLALGYAGRGWRVFPLHTVINGKCSCTKSCGHAGKHPRTPKGVKDATTTRGRIKRWWRKWPEANIGIATGALSGIFVVDIDGDIGKASLKALKAEHGPLPKTVTVKTGNGRHYYFRCDGAHVGNSAGKIGENIDVRGDGGYVVSAGSIHLSGVKYRFVEGRGPDEIEVAKAPKWLLNLVTAKDVASEAVELPAIPAEKLDRAKAYADVALRRELDRLGKAPQHQRNDTLNLAAFKLGQLLPYDILDRQKVTDELTTTARTIGLDEGEIAPTIASGLDKGSRFPRGLPFLKSDLPAVEPPAKSKDKVTEELAALGETDTDNGQRFATRFGANVINTPGRGWLVYDGRRRLPDELFKVKELAKTTARLIADEARFLKEDSVRTARRNFATQSLSTGALDRMLESAKSLLAVEDSRLDADAWLLNVENGTINLRTGLREKHDARDLLTKIAPVRANRRAKCPLFTKFLRRITDNNKELQTFIRKCVGYTLTGDMSEQVFFFVHGASGNNGKSTLVNLIRNMLGDYGIHTPTDSFLVKQYDNNIPADLARFAGARMVTAIEANANRQIDEAKIKGITGGEPITARFMRQNFFQFTPECKLWLVANDRPRVRGTDDAFWRRVRLIPLNVTILTDEVDPDLPLKLQAEWPGILAWAVCGCLKWQKKGLLQPESIRAATDAWHSEMDHLKRFVADQLIMSPGASVAASTVFDMYKKWCLQHGEQALIIQKFTAKFRETFDITHKRSKGHSFWKGIAIRS